MKTIKLLAELTKFKITSFSTVTTVVGFLVAGGGEVSTLFAVTIGVLALACGSAVFNQYQERHIDARMARTNGRPLPSGRVSPPTAFLLAAGLVFSGSVLLLTQTNLTATLLGWMAVLWYNGIYTPLKRVTAFAAVPGAVIGALPPAIGWTAAGGALSDPKIVMFSFFFFVWQVPHFWLLLLLYGGDYARAGLPSLTQRFSRRQLQRITFVWVMAAALSCLLLPLVGLVDHPLLLVILIMAVVWMVVTAARTLAFFHRPYSFGAVFRGINLFALIYLTVLTADRFL